MKQDTLIIISLLLGFSICNDCRFAPSYSQQDLYDNKDVREQFLTEVLRWESNFMKKIGYDNKTGLSLDGQPLDVETGLPIGLPHQYTASSKESLHVAILAKVLEGNDRAKNLYSTDEALEILEKKISTYEDFQRNYPAFGGFLPWMHVDENGVSPQHFDWTAGIPSLDNGQLFWSAYGLTQVLEEKYPDQKELLNRWENFWQAMVNNSVKIFYEGNGNIRQVSIFNDSQKSVDENDYWSWITDCHAFTHDCYLDDPYEGELFTTMMYLFAKFENEGERDLIWLNKRTKLQAVDYFVKELGSNITVEKGWWYSAHEKWKYFFLPYFDSEINKKVFLNGEKMRTWDAKQNNLGGMFASVTGTIKNNNETMNYYSDCGIPEVSFSGVSHVTPYSTMALFLADEASATVWYHNMLMGPAGQTLYGSVESLNVDGTAVSPLGTWDSKATTVVGILGGLGDIVGRKLEKTGYKDQLIDIIDKEWNMVFDNRFNGEDLPFALPNTQIPHNRPDFTSCSQNDIKSFMQ